MTNLHFMQHYKTSKQKWGIQEGYQFQLPILRICFLPFLSIFTLIKLIKLLIQNVLNFDFEFSLHFFIHDFERKICLMWYSVNWHSFIIWFPFLLKILVNMCIAIVCVPDCDIINFEINLIFLVKLYFTWPKSQDCLFSLIPVLIFIENELGP